MKKIVFAIIGLTLLFSSCERTVYDFPTGTLKGNILPPGVKVTFDQGDKKYTTISDENGDYIIQNLEMGSYTIIYEKEGYFEFKKFGYQFLGGPSVEDLTDHWIHELNPMPEKGVDLISVSCSEGYYFAASGKYPYLGPNFSRALPIAFFVSDQPDVSPDNYLAVFIKDDYLVLPDYGKTDFSVKLYSGNVRWETDNISNKSKLYFVAYLSIYYDWKNYFNWDTNKMVFGLGPVASDVIEVAIPEGFNL